jgi:hypothetical protein
MDAYVKTGLLVWICMETSEMDCVIITVLQCRIVDSCIIRETRTISHYQNTKSNYNSKDVFVLTVAWG